MKTQIMTLILIMSPIMAQAESIQLKSGMILEGEVTDVTGEYIRIKTEDAVLKVKRKLVADERWAIESQERNIPPEGEGFSQGFLGGEILNNQQCVEEIEAADERSQEKKTELIARLKETQEFFQREQAYFNFFTIIDNLKTATESLLVSDECGHFRSLMLRRLQLGRDYVWQKFELEKLEGQGQSQEKERVRRTFTEQGALLETLGKEWREERDRMRKQYGLK